MSVLRPRVTVVIVNWNGEKFLYECLAAVTSQSVRPHEIILLDNASTDDSLAIARRFDDVRIIALDENTGFARGNNLAIAAASVESEWIALLNPDAYADHRWLEALVEASVEYADFDTFGSRLVSASNRSVLDGAGDVYHMSGLVWRSLHGAPVSSDSATPREVFAPCAAAAMYRRSALVEAGGFDEDYFCYVEDVDLGFALRLAGHRALQVPDSVAYHVGSGTTGGKQSPFSVYHGHRNLVWTFCKRMPGWLFWALLPLHVAINIAAVLLFVSRGQTRVILRAKRDAIAGLPRIWRKRRDIQARRTVGVSTVWKFLDKSIAGKSKGLFD